MVRLFAMFLAFIPTIVVFRGFELIIAKWRKFLELHFFICCLFRSFNVAKLLVVQNLFIQFTFSNAFRIQTLVKLFYIV